MLMRSRFGAALTGIATIVCTGLLGLAWRHVRRHRLARLSRGRAALAVLLTVSDEEAGDG